MTRPCLRAALAAAAMLVAALPNAAQDAHHEPTFGEMSSRMRHQTACSKIEIRQILAVEATQPRLAQVLARLARDPEDAELRLALGNELARLGQWDLAEEAYRCALRNDSRLAAAHNNLGIARLRAADYPSAIRALRQSLRLDRGNPRTHYNLATALDLGGQYDAALEHYEIAFALAPRMSTIRNNPMVARNEHRTAIFLRRLLAEQASLGSALQP